MADVDPKAPQRVVVEIFGESYPLRTDDPARLKKLDPPTLAMSEAEKAHLRDIFDAREPYRFVPHEKHSRRKSGTRV